MSANFFSNSIQSSSLEDILKTESSKSFTVTSRLLTLMTELSTITKEEGRYSVKTGHHQTVYSEYLS